MLTKFPFTQNLLHSHIFPVILINPVSCSSCIPLKSELFDFVVFDEASQLRLEDTFPALIRGKCQIISGDDKQMPPITIGQSVNSNIIQLNDNEMSEDDEDEEYQLDDQDSISSNTTLIDTLAESLLDYGTEQNYVPSYLDFHYRSEHPDLIQFSNAAFYKSQLTPMPQSKNYKSISFYQINGEYENKRNKRINKDEAFKIIDILKNIKVDKYNKFPSVGIATFNECQQDYIQDCISEELEKNEEFRNHYEKNINRNDDFFVKNLAEIQGDERDIIIISTTFGVNQDGRFDKRFGPINQDIKDKGSRLLNVIFTRAKKEIHICTSIPEKEYSRYSDGLKSGRSRGRYILYAYLAYAKAIHSDDADSKKHILEILKYTSPTENNFFLNDSNSTTNQFADQVISCIKDQIGSLQIEKNYKIGGFTTDFVILKENRPMVAVVCDGFKHNNISKDKDIHYLWNIFPEKQINRVGIKCLSVFSEKWWENHQRETNDLINKINEIERGFIELEKNKEESIDIINSNKFEDSEKSQNYNKFFAHSNPNYDGIEGLAESPLEEEVVDFLSENIDKNRIILQHRVIGFRIDIVIKSKETGLPVLAIECDGKAYHQNTIADIEREKELTNEGFRFYRISSTDWWDDEIHNEVEKELLEFIRKYDDEEASLLHKEEKKEGIIQNSFIF